MQRVDKDTFLIGKLNVDDFDVELVCNKSNFKIALL